MADTAHCAGPHADAGRGAPVATAPRPLPPDLVRAVYGLWLAALALKVLGASWDMSWHFTWLRDDLAPPHLLNSAGHGRSSSSWWSSTAGRATASTARRCGSCRRASGSSSLAVPLDLVNHRINGLDLTAWSPTHALLYLGTALMLAGVVRGWWLYGSGRARDAGAGAAVDVRAGIVWFPAQQQEYGVLAVAAWDRGRSRGRTDPAAVRRRPDRPAGRPRGRRCTSRCRRGVGLPGVAGRRRRPSCSCWPGG